MPARMAEFDHPTAIRRELAQEAAQRAEIRHEGARQLAEERAKLGPEVRQCG